jgi:hypothetical protein
MGRLCASFGGRWGSASAVDPHRTRQGYASIPGKVAFGPPPLTDLEHPESGMKVMLAQTLILATNWASSFLDRERQQAFNRLDKEESSYVAWRSRSRTRGVRVSEKCSIRRTTLPVTETEWPHLTPPSKAGIRTDLTIRNSLGARAKTYPYSHLLQRLGDLFFQLDLPLRLPWRVAFFRLGRNGATFALVEEVEIFGASATTPLRVSSPGTAGSTH